MVSRSLLLPVLACLLSSSTGQAEPALTPRYELAPQVMRTGHATVVAGDRLYVIGGRTTQMGGDDGSSFLRSVVSVKIAADGSLSDWRDESPLDLPRGYASAVVARGHVYVIGGYKDDTPGGTGMVPGILRALIGPDGKLGSWELVNPSWKGARAEAAVVGNSLYVVGGLSSTGSASTRIWELPLGSDGALGDATWVGDTAIPHQRFALVSYGGSLIALGGYRPEDYRVHSRAVEGIEIKADGSLGRPTLDDGLPVGVANHDAVVVDGRLIVAGGNELGGINDRLDVAVLCHDGAILAWARSFTLPEGRAGATLAVSGNSLFIVGGAQDRGIAPTIEVLSLQTLVGGTMCLTGLVPASPRGCIPPGPALTNSPAIEPAPAAPAPVEVAPAAEPAPAAPVAPPVSGAE